MNEQQQSINPKTGIQEIQRIKKGLVDNGFLGEALLDTKVFLNTFHNAELENRLEKIDNDYTLMRDFLSKGYRDEKRDTLYQSLIGNLYRLLQDVVLEYEKVHNPMLFPHLQYQSTLSFDVDSIREKLESFVSEVAFSSLEINSNQSELLKTVYSEHHYYIQQLFDAILFTQQWSHDFAMNLANLLISPTIDSLDAQLFVSVMSLGAIYNKDPERLLALLEIYKQTNDEHIKQRALSGWVMGVDDDMLKVFTSVNDEISAELDNEKTRTEVLELQMQVIYCRNAQRDTEKLKQDIMPTLLKNQQFEITPTGIKPKEEDSLEDILHPDAADKKMEELEQSLHKMMDMKQQGVDIYFGGFSQMKRFSFFYTESNWFIPFTKNHPQLQHLSTDFLNSGMIKTILDSGSFCDSDKYSFVLATASIYDRLPANILEALNAGQGSMEIYGDHEIDMTDPTYIRRMYLQDLYRFFTLSDFRRLFENPFDHQHFLFLLHPIFHHKMGYEARRIQKFLLKQKMYSSLSRLFYAYKDHKNINDLKMETVICMHDEDYLQAIYLYELILKASPNDRQALAGYSQASFIEGDYKEAAIGYRMLLEHDPDNKAIALNLAISLINNDEAEEGVKILYRLEYEQPEDINVKRALAWGQLYLGKTEQAKQLYQTILPKESHNSSDYLNAGYAAWFSRDISRAIVLFHNSLAMVDGRPKQPQEVLKLFSKDAGLLQRYGITLVEQKLIADMVCASFLGLQNNKD